MTPARDLRTRLGSTREALANRNLARLLFVWGVWVTTDWASADHRLSARPRPQRPRCRRPGRRRPGAARGGAHRSAVRPDRPLAARSAAGCGVRGMGGLAALLVWSAATEATLGLLLVIISVGSALAAVIRPTLQAMMPTLVSTPSQLITANSAYSTIEALGTVLGPGSVCGTAGRARSTGRVRRARGLFAGGGAGQSVHPHRLSAGPAERRIRLAGLARPVPRFRRPRRPQRPADDHPFFARRPCAACSTCSWCWWPRRVLGRQ